MSERYGLFRQGGDLLALPIATLREAVPRQPLAMLPGSPPFVLGSLDLRGQRVPVTDLRRLGQTPSSPQPAPEGECIVIVQYQDRVLGLVADAVDGVCEGKVLPLDSGEAGILTGSLQLQGQGCATLLDPARLLHYPGMPAALQAPRHDKSPADAPPPGASEETTDTLAHVMLMRCGSVPLAIGCQAIHTIILNPQVSRNAISSGYCLGTITYAGYQIAAVSLLAACGVPLHPAPALRQAFVIHYPDGFLAFMVEDIIDVVQRTGHTLHPLPAQSLMRPDHFCGAIPAAETPADSVARHATPSGHYLLLDSAALLARHDLQRLAAMNTPLGEAAGGQGQPDKRRQQGERCQLLSYDLGFEVATPVSQIADIIPWREEQAVFGLACEHAGLLIGRGRSIPLYCLSSTLGIPLAPIRDTASVLVIETDIGVAGFAVPGLITIEETWQDKLQQAETSGPPAQIRQSRSDVAWRHLLVGQGKQERLLSLLDLQALAQDRLSALPAAHQPG